VAASRQSDCNGRYVGLDLWYPRMQRAALAIGSGFESLTPYETPTGHVERLPSGSWRVKVYAETDPPSSLRTVVHRPVAALVLRSSPLRACRPGTR
jgi:hypothetical protein